MTLDPSPISFRPLQVTDLELEWRWRNSGEVLKWYSKREVPYEELAAKLTARIEGREPSHCYLVLYDGQPIGHMQTYRVKDFPALAEAFALQEEAASVDMFIGEPEFTHRGLGAPVLRQFLREIVFAQEDIVSCAMGPEPDNTIARRAYEKAGLRYLRTVQIAGDEEPTYLMYITREELFRDEKAAS